eukprot:2640866-Amphidinium_carterae.1
MKTLVLHVFSHQEPGLVQMHAGFYRHFRERMACKDFSTLKVFGCFKKIRDVFGGWSFAQLLSPKTTIQNLYFGVPENPKDRKEALKMNGPCVRALFCGPRMDHYTRHTTLRKETENN